MKKSLAIFLFASSLVAQVQIGKNVQIGAGSTSVSTTLQTNGTNNSSQTTLNFINPSSYNGLTFTFSNPTLGNETFTIGGTLGNAGLANSSTTVNGQTCTLGSTCTISAGGSSVGTAGQLQMRGSTAGSFAASAATDNGTTFSVSEPASFNDGTGKAGAIQLQQGTTPSAAPANTIQINAPTAVTAYSVVLPGTQGTGSLTNNGSGTLTWAAGGGTSNPTTCTVNTVGNKCLGLSPYLAVSGDWTTAVRQAISDSVGEGATQINIYVPAGDHPLNGSLTNTCGENAVIGMPCIPYFNGSGITIRFIGLGGWPNQFPGGSSFSTSITTGNLFGGNNTGSESSPVPFTFVWLGMEGITITGPTNTGAVMVNAQHIAGFAGKHLAILAPGSTPSNTAGAGLLLPIVGNNDQSIIDDVTVGGFYTGIGSIGEHSVLGRVIAGGGHDCFVFDLGTPTGFGVGSVTVLNMATSICVHGISAGVTQASYINILQADFDVSNTVDIYDPSNFLNGSITYKKGSLGSTHTPITVTGAANLNQNSTQWPADSVNAGGTLTLGNTLTVNNPAPSTSLSPIGSFQPNLTTGSHTAIAFGKSITAHNAGFMVWYALATPYVSLESYAAGDPINLAGSSVWAPGGTYVGNSYVPGAASPPSSCAGLGVGTTAQFCVNLSGAATIPSVNGTTIPASSTLPVTIASGTSALGTSAIASATCATVVTTTATGTASTDAIIWNPNASIKAVTGYVPATTGGLSISGYPTTNAVNWDVCNWTSASITPGAVTLNFRVVR